MNLQVYPFTHKITLCKISHMFPTVNLADLLFHFSLALIYLHDYIASSSSCHTLNNIYTIPAMEKYYYQQINISIKCTEKQHKKSQKFNHFSEGKKVAR